MKKKHQIGQTDLEINPIIFGGNVFGWTLDQKQSFDILDQFLELGFETIDTANNYSYWVPGNKGGESETIIGNWLNQRKKRSDVVLMTKVGGRFSFDTKHKVSYDYIKQEAEQSLIRLQTDYIDLYQTHYDVLETPVEETLRAYEDLVKEGKVRYIGASNMSPERILESLQASSRLNLPRYVSLQPEYNLYDRQKFEETYQNVAAKNNLAVIPYYSLASGFLSGKYLSDEDFDKSARGEGIEKRYWNDRGRTIVKALTKVADEYGASCSAVALAWLLAKPTITAPIVSGTKRSHLNSFTEAVNLRLSGKTIEELDIASKY